MSAELQSNGHAQQSAWTVDRLEGDYVVLCATELDAEISLPRSLCPRSICEGDQVSLTVELNQASSEEARREVALQVEALSASDDGDDFSL